MFLEAAFATLISTAAPGCPPHQVWLDTLQEKFGEKQIFQGFTPTGGLVRFYLNPENGSWTATLETSGYECQKANGGQGIMVKPGEKSAQSLTRPVFFEHGGDQERSVFNNAPIFQ